MGELVYALILAFNLAAANDADRYPDADEVYHCPFDEASDVNYDTWPDGWTRRRGPGFPRYLPVEIRDDPSAKAGKALFAELDGGAVSVFSPSFPADSRSGYVLEARVKTERLERSEVLLSLTFFDRHDQPVEVHWSDPLGGENDWTGVHLGPVSTAHSETVKAAVGLHVLPRTSSDLHATVRFDDVWLGRLPRMVVRTSRPVNLYDDPSQVEVGIELSGIRDEELEIHLTLLDALGRELQHEVRRVDAVTSEADRLVLDDGATGSGPVGPDSGPPGAAPPGLGRSSTIRWQPPIPDTGYYEVRVNMRTERGLLHTRLIPIAVLGPVPTSPRGAFGWTLPRGDDRIALDVLAQLIPQVGIHWLKFPLWYPQEDADRGHQLLKFAQHMEVKHIQMVGILDRHPAATAKTMDAAATRLAAALFSADPQSWFPSLDPVMTTLSLRIHYWQLGADRDTSFVNYPDLDGKIRALRGQLFRLGQKAYLGFGWRWLSEPPSAVSPSWDFVTYSEDPPLTPAELATYLEGIKDQRGKRWVLVEPLPESRFDLTTRVRDLVEQMVSAKQHQADAIFLPDPLDPERGVIRPDTSPGPLLLPWRTAAMVLGGMRYLGSIRMPGGSHNELFTREGQTAMVVWNEKPVREEIYLGRNVRQIDVWGRTTELAQEGHRQVVEVGEMPVFLLGVDLAVAKWRMDLALASTHMPSVFGQSHPNTISVKNSFDRGVNGTMTFVLPPRWRSNPPETTLRLRPGQEATLPFEITLPLAATSGVRPVRLDLDVSAGRRYQFSVYRQIEIGLGDVEIYVTTHLQDDGSLLVEQRTINHSETPITFRFHIYAPNRRSKRAHVVELGHGEDLKHYRFSDGQSLVGKTLWLRAEEIDGPRSFNHRVVVEP